MTCFLLRKAPVFAPQVRSTDRTPLVDGPAPNPLKSIQKASGFKFSQRSTSRLETVHPSLQAVTRRALELSTQDFGITEGLRSKTRQAELVASGASKTMNSRHLTGHAVDVLAYNGAKHSWVVTDYYAPATAFVWAADELGVAIRWGGAWHIKDIRECRVKDDPGETMLTLYKEARRRQGRKVFIDAVHFEMPK